MSGIGFRFRDFFRRECGVADFNTGTGLKRFGNDIDYQLVLEGASRLSSAAGLPQLSLSGSGFSARFSLDAG